MTDKKDWASNGGVYMIVCEANDEVYIGQTRCFRERWTNHRRHLRENRHYNRFLQGNWNKYGEEAFRFAVVEGVKTNDDSNLLDKEALWIKDYSETHKLMNIMKIDENSYVLSLDELEGDGAVIVPFGWTGSHRPSWHKYVYGGAK